MGDVSGNRLETLPDSLCRLRSLTRLLLSSNKLKTLPLQSSGGGLCRLQHIDAADNGISSISTATLQLQALSELWLKGNPIDRLALQETPGFGDFAERRKRRLDQRINQNVTGGIDLTMCGLE